MTSHSDLWIILRKIWNATPSRTRKKIVLSVHVMAGQEMHLQLKIKGQPYYDPATLMNFVAGGALKFGLGDGSFNPVPKGDIFSYSTPYFCTNLMKSLLVSEGRWAPQGLLLRRPCGANAEGLD